MKLIGILRVTFLRFIRSPKKYSFMNGEHMWCCWFCILNLNIHRQISRDTNAHTLKCILWLNSTIHEVDNIVNPLNEPFSYVCCISFTSLSILFVSYHFTSRPPSMHDAKHNLYHISNSTVLISHPIDNNKSICYCEWHEEDVSQLFSTPFVFISQSKKKVILFHFSKLSDAWRFLIFLTLPDAFLIDSNISTTKIWASEIKLTGNSMLEIEITVVYAKLNNELFYRQSSFYNESDTD